MAVNPGIEWLADNWGWFLENHQRAMAFLQRGIKLANQKLADGIAGPFPPALEGRLRIIIGHITYLETSLIELAKQTPAIVGNPPQLYVAATAWEHDVHGLMGGLSVGEESLQALPQGDAGQRWNDNAAQLYAAASRSHQKTIDGMNECHSAISGALTQTALANAQVLPAVVIALVTADLAIAGAILALDGGIPGMIAGAGLIATALGIAISAIVGIIVAAIAYLSGIASASGGLTQQLNEVPATWPQPQYTDFYSKVYQ
ncbi:hypothetical protein [Tenggerimyces flavus]|uniref:Uncharacterized protein n=1 Tax=Tenggerimyces flavus TaxID=1708749 RepID=A0ABV7YMT5_9ACTN|nr:hypothetical protein [Tenggerimyces flavus]MBM7790394.1 hypothetical protein [Tenggerimyces flavus]